MTMSTPSPLADVVAHLDPDERANAAAVIRAEVRRRLRRGVDLARYKRCPRCYLQLPGSEFGRHAGRTDGLQAVCKVCRKAARETSEQSST